MRWFSFIVILLVATLLEAGNLLNIFAIGGWYIRPSLLITVMVFYALVCQSRDAIICCFMIGFAADLTAQLMGPHMICFGVLGLLLNQSKQILFARRAMYKALIVFAVYFIAETLSYWLEMIRGMEGRENYYSILLFAGLYSAIISPILWSILSALSGWLNINKSRSNWIYH